MKAWLAFVLITGAAQAADLVDPKDGKRRIVCESAVTHWGTWCGFQYLQCNKWIYPKDRAACVLDVFEDCGVPAYCLAITEENR